MKKTSIMLALLLAMTAFGTGAIVCEADENVELSYITWRTEDTDILNEMIAQFEAENPNIKVNMEMTSNDQTEYYAVLKSRLLSGEGGDVFMVHPGPFLKDLADSGYCMELEPEMYENITPGFLMAGQANGKQYALPETCNTFVTYFNEDIFSELGIEIPTDYESLVAACQTCKDAGYMPIAIGLGETWVTDILYESLICDWAEDSANAMHALETGDETLTGELYTNVFGDVVKMVEDGIFQDNLLGTGYEAGISLFASGKAAMLLDGNWTVATLMEMNPDLNFGVFPIFNTAGVGKGILNPGQDMAINPNSAHLEEAKKFMEFFYSKEGEEMYCNATVQPSSVQGVELDIPALNMINDAMGSDPVTWPDIAVENTKLMEIVEELCARLAGGGVDLTEELERAQAEVEAM